MSLPAAAAGTACGVMLMLGLGTPGSLHAQDSDWPMFRRTPGGIGSARLKVPGRFVAKAWQFQAGSHVWGYQPGMTVWTSVAVGVVKGKATVLVGSYDHNLYSLDPATGKKRWRFTTGGGIYSTPVLWNGMAFVASSDRILYALDADLGRRMWTHAVQTWRPTIGGARLSSPCVGRADRHDAVFFGHWVWDKSLKGHMQRGGISALNVKDGKRIWTTRLGDNQVSSPIFVELKQGRRLFVASENGNLYALAADTGKILWTHTDRNAIKSSPAFFSTVLGPRVIIGSKFGMIRCLDALTGREIWRYKTSHWVDGSAAIAEIDGRLVALVGSYDTNLYALDALSGEVLWSHGIPGGIYSSPAVVRRGKQTLVLFTGWDHHLHCVNANSGSLVWSAFLGRPIWDSLTLGDSIWSSPTVADINGQQVAFIGAYSGPLHAIPLDQAASKALARPSSNIDFWITLPVVMVVVGLVTIIMSRRHRKKMRQERGEADLADRT